MKQSRTVARPAVVESPRHLPLVDLLIDARSELFELAVRSGLKVLETMLEEDRTAVCGPRYAHLAERGPSRAGTVSSEVVLGGRKIAVRRPRVRAGGHEVPLPTFQAMADVDPLNRRVVEQMLLGVATRRYARSLEPVPVTMRSRGTSKSAVSRRFVAKTAAQLAAWQTASLEDLDLVGLLIDGVHIGEHCLIVALGIAADGQKHALGLWDGSTENTRICQDLLANLHSRGLRTDRSLLVILDGSKALRKAVRATFGELLLDLARRLEHEYPSAAESVREGLDETLTVLTLKLSPRLRRSLATTNAAESLISRTRMVKRNVKRWRGGQMMLRWVAAGILEAVKGFRRVKGYADMPTLVNALRARDRQLGLLKADEDRQVA
jgi:putative transposase